MEKNKIDFCTSNVWWTVSGGETNRGFFLFISVDYETSRYENVNLKINYKKKKQLFFKRVVFIEFPIDFRKNNRREC